MSEELDESPAVEALFDHLLNEVGPAFTALAERAGASNEELEHVASTWAAKGGSLAHAFAGLCGMALNTRRVHALHALIRPGELDAVGGISIADLVEREARTKADA